MLRFKSDITTISYLQIDILIFEHKTKKSNSEVYFVYYYFKRYLLLLMGYYLNFL